MASLNSNWTPDWWKASIFVKWKLFRQIFHGESFISLRIIIGACPIFASIQCIFRHLHQWTFIIIEIIADFNFFFAKILHIFCTFISKGYLNTFAGPSLWTVRKQGIILGNGVIERLTGLVRNLWLLNKTYFVWIFPPFLILLIVGVIRKCSLSIWQMLRWNWTQVFL